jgi:uncharacterized protein (TIGR00268 family)
MRHHGQSTGLRLAPPPPPTTTTTLNSATCKFFSSSSPTFNADEGLVQVTKTKTSSSIKLTTTPVYHPESQEATVLVDELLEYTQSLMKGCSHHLIAYSGGIDSSLVAALVHQSAASANQDSVRAVLGLSPAVPQEQVQLAQEVAHIIGIPLEQIPTTEGTDRMYIENSGQACLACKTHLYTCLEAIVERYTKNNTIQYRLYNGTNADDLKDPTRLGLIAADRFDVQSPLRYTPKAQVRIAARHLGLPNWNYAASPCLRSRLALGVQAIPQHLHRIDQAERYVRTLLQFNASQNMRVRLLTHNRAMVEVEEDQLTEAHGWLETWQPYFHELGFASVNVRCFKTGSVAQ